MTIPSIGLTGDVSTGTAGIGAYQPMTRLIKEHAVGILRDTIASEAPILSKRILRQETREGEEYVWDVFAGPQPSTCWIRDFQPLPRGSALLPVKGRALPSTVFDRIEVGRGAAEAKLSAGDDKFVTFIQKNIENTGKQCARHLARGLYGGSVSPQDVATWSGTAANSTVTVPFTDVTMFKPGAAYDFIDTSAGLAYVVRCTGVSYAALGGNTDNTSGNVSFINDVKDTSSAAGAITALGATGITTSDFFKLRGTTVGFGGSSTTVTGNPIVSFDDIAGTGAVSPLYGIDPATMPGWAGNFSTLGGIYNQEFFIAKMAKMRNLGSEKLNRCVMNPNMIAAHAASSGQSSATFGNTAGISPTYVVQLDRSRDKYGDIGETTYSVGGVKITEDPNVPATTAIMWNNESVYLAWWREIAPEEEAGDAVLVGRSLLNFEVQVRGAAQLIAEDRKSVLVVSGVTGI